jgi:ERF superfamily
MSDIELHHEASSMLDVIARAAKDPTVNVEKLERLLAIQERLLADRRRTAFMADLSELQARLPQIAKSGNVIVNGQLRSKFARIEDVDTAIRPLCREWGFAFSFDSRAVAGGLEFTCTMSHREGHAETKTLTLPVDTGPGRNGVQAVGSTTSYARRYLLAMHLHLVTRNEDDDGNGGHRPVTEEQAGELRTSLTAAGGNEARFLNWLAAESFETIPAANYERARKFIEAKGRGVT